MYEITISEERELNFEMELSGIAPSQLKGRLAIEIDGIEYGLPVRFNETGMSVTIPPLKNIIKRDLREGEVFKATLDVFGDSHYLNPWNEEFKIKNPVKMEAKLVDGDDKVESLPKLKVSLAEKKAEEYKKVIKEEKVTKPKQKRFQNVEDFKKKLTREDVFGWLKKNGTKNETIQELVYEQTASEIGSTQPYKILVALQNVYKHKK